MSDDLIIRSIINFVKTTKLKVKDMEGYSNAIQNSGSGFEDFVKQLFLGNRNLSNQNKLIEYHKIFSFQGAANNPPDLILDGSYAIKINKKKTTKSIIPLNSSHPKDSIVSSDGMLKSDTRKIEGGQWIKELFYYIGEVTDNQCKSLFIIDGSCYTAKEALYQNVITKIKGGIAEIPDVKLLKTKELGKVKNIDPMQITDLRIRGMWNILHPLLLVERYTDIDVSSYNLLAVMKKEKYDNVSDSFIKSLTKLEPVTIHHCKWPNPNNLSDLFDVVIIKG